jgi:hypothetical protein
MDRRLGRFRKLLELRGRLEWIGTTQDDGEVAAAHKNMLECIGWITSFYTRDRPEPGQAIADLLTVVEFVEWFLNQDGRRSDWGLLHVVAAKLREVPIQPRRATVVRCIEATVKFLYGLEPKPEASFRSWNPETAVMDHWEAHGEILPVRTAADVSPNEFDMHVSELRKELHEIEPQFGNLELGVLRELLSRADPAKPKAISAPYVAAWASLLVGAFGEKLADGESLESASRTVANTFRNAAAKSV